uniref:Uncharacterized protein n=1 Tax=Cacopsylla melanoneura TaxID=428564 RepID=A0A8D8ZB02_9HEMI
MILIVTYDVILCILTREHFFVFKICFDLFLTVAKPAWVWLFGAGLNIRCVSPKIRVQQVSGKILPQQKLYFENRATGLCNKPQHSRVSQFSNFPLFYEETLFLKHTLKQRPR